MQLTLFGMGEQKLLQASYQLNCSQTYLATDLQMVCKFKFVCYGIIKVLYVPWFNSGGPIKSDASIFYTFFIFSSHMLNCSKNDLETDLPMVCKFKLVRCSHSKIEFGALCVPFQKYEIV